MDRLKEALLRYFPDRGNFDVEDFIHAYGDPRQALLMFPVFFPEFSSVEGHVILSDFLDDDAEPGRLIATLRASPGRARSVLEGYRWREIPYLFADLSKLSDEDDSILAELVACAWKGALSVQFPDSVWVTRVMTPEETGSVVGVCFEESV